MILHALKDYYDRKADDTDSEIASQGFEEKQLQFLIVIDEEGNFINIEDTREKVGNKLVAKSFFVPRSKKRSGSRSYETTFFLWDHIGYLLGLPEDEVRALKQHKTWLNFLENLPPELKADSGVKAILKFYEKGEIKKAIASPQIQDCLKSVSCNMAFRLIYDVPVPCRKAVKKYIQKSNSGMGETGICLVSGETGEVVRVHNATPINKDSKNLISFQKDSGYDSYGKEQGYNAPIIASTEFAYVTALNTLLKSRTQRLLIGDAVTVFWSEKKSDFENDFASYFKEPEKDNPDEGIQKIKELFESPKYGSHLDNDSNTGFYILGLSPNSARIAVRLWQTGTINEFATKIKQYFKDFEIVKPPNEPEFYSVWRILVNIAIQDKSKNIPPNLAADFMRAILEEMPYPATLLQAALRRIRSDTENRVKPVRAALIKAYLNRYNRFYYKNIKKEVKKELDTSQPSIGYQLGRLFAILEKIQEEANPGINATIKERYYGSACASPVTVFGTLLRLKQHHLVKIKNRGRAVNFERMIGDVMGHINCFPAYLDLHEQGYFAIGYYHQRRDLFTKKEKTESGSKE